MQNCTQQSTDANQKIKIHNTFRETKCWKEIILSNKKRFFSFVFFVVIAFMKTLRTFIYIEFSLCTQWNVKYWIFVMSCIKIVLKNIYEGIFSYFNYNLRLDSIQFNTFHYNTNSFLKKNNTQNKAHLKRTVSFIFTTSIYI